MANFNSFAVDSGWIFLREYFIVFIHSFFVCSIDIFIYIYSDHLINWGHLLQTIMHMIQVSVSYFVMLVLMTYNWTICISVVLGAVMGYFLFGYARYRLFSDSSLLNIVNDVNNDDHCT